MNIKYFEICECCNYKALDQSKWNIHIRSEKHKRNGKNKFEDRICEICGYWSMHLRYFNMHKIIAHGTIAEKKTAPFYCECCNMAFFCTLFYNKHIISKKHLQNLKNNKFNDLDNLLIDKNYMDYINKLDNKIKNIDINLKIHNNINYKL